MKKTQVWNSFLLLLTVMIWGCVGLSMVGCLFMFMAIVFAQIPMPKKKKEGNV